MKEKIVPPSLRVFFGFDSTRLLNMVLDRIGKHGLLDGVIVRLRFHHGMVSRLRFDETTLLRPINPDGKLAAPSTWRVRRVHRVQRVRRPLNDRSYVRPEHPLHPLQPSRYFTIVNENGC